MTIDPPHTPFGKGGVNLREAALDFVAAESTRLMVHKTSVDIKRVTLIVFLNKTFTGSTCNAFASRHLSHANKVSKAHLIVVSQSEEPNWCHLW